jgi:hypothetical protein
MASRPRWIHLVCLLASIGRLLDLQRERARLFSCVFFLSGLLVCFGVGSGWIHSLSSSSVVVCVLIVGQMSFRTAIVCCDPPIHTRSNHNDASNVCARFISSVASLGRWVFA